MLVPCEFPTHDSGQKRFLWANKKVEFASYPVVGPVLQVEDAEKFPLALGVENMDSFVRFSKQSPRLTAKEDDGDGKRLVQLRIV